MALSTASYSTSMGRSVRSCLSKQNENRWPTRFPSQAGGTLSASLTATIWSRRLGWHICLSSDDVLEVGQGLQGICRAVLQTKKAASAGCGFRSSTGLKVHPKLRPRSPPLEQDHRVASVLGSAARREPHSRHPEPLEAVVSADTRASGGGGGSRRWRIITLYPR